jgi:hypothetical protein
VHAIPVANNRVHAEAAVAGLPLARTERASRVSWSKLLASSRSSSWVFVWYDLGDLPTIRPEPSTKMAASVNVTRNYHPIWPIRLRIITL